VIGAALVVLVLYAGLVTLLFADANHSLSYWKEQAKVARIQRNAALDALDNRGEPFHELELARAAAARGGRPS